MSYDKMPGMQVTIQRSVPATMRDGTVLHADVYRPITDEVVPVILGRSPYGKRVNTATFGNAHPAWYAERGYVVVIQDVRGRSESEGDWYPFLHEMEDGYDSVEWAARLPGSNGSVGMLGFSYLGATQMLAAVMRPPSLRTIVPGFTASQYYDGWTYNGGAFAVAFICYWANLLALDTATRHENEATLGALLASLGSAPDWFWAMPMSEYPPLQDSYAQYFYDWVEHHTYDDYWRRWSIDEDYSRIDVSALHIAGWYDIFLSGSVKNFSGLSLEGRPAPAPTTSTIGIFAGTTRC
jgi:putative CocE/NonD family hydrolase